MVLRQALVRVALVIETILIVLIATAVIPFCLTVLAVGNRIGALARSDQTTALPAREN